MNQLVGALAARKGAAISLLNEVFTAVESASEMHGAWGQLGSFQHLKGQLRRHYQVAHLLIGLLDHSFQLADDSRVCPVGILATAVSTPTDDGGRLWRAQPSSSREGRHKAATGRGCSSWQVTCGAWAPH